jgi:hypothetical protein
VGGPAFWRPLAGVGHWPPGQVTEGRAAVTLGVVRAGYGVTLLWVPGRLIRLVSGAEPNGRACGVARVLGVRHLMQAALTVAVGRRAGTGPIVLACGAGVDLTHVVSMVALGGVFRSARRAALADAVLETALGVAGIVAAGGNRHQRRTG